MIPAALRLRRRGPQAVALAAIALTASGCVSGGLNALPMPGTGGHGPGSFTVTIEVPDVATLPQNSPVMVNNVTVGRVSGVELVQRPDHSSVAAVRLTLDGDVVLPANAVAMVSQTSLLGSLHVELSRPAGEGSVGRLANGSTIATPRAGRYPTTEEVLTALGSVVNNGGLGNVQDITNAAYTALAGRSASLATLVPRLAKLTAALDEQTGAITELIEQLDRIATTLAQRTSALEDALTELPRALRVLNMNRGNIVKAFTALRRLSSVAAEVLAKSKRDLAADVHDIYPVIKAFNDNRADLVSAVPLLFTFPFPETGIKRLVRGDFMNGFSTFDLTQRRLGENLFTTSPIDPNMAHMWEVVNAPEWLIGSQANLSGQAADPFRIPAGTASGHDQP